MLVDRRTRRGCSRTVQAAGAPTGRARRHLPGGVWLSDLRSLTFVLWPWRFWSDLATTRSPTHRRAVPWARCGFTAEFGMGSGGARTPWSPGRSRSANIGDQRSEIKDQTRSGSFGSARRAPEPMLDREISHARSRDPDGSRLDPPPAPCQPPRTLRPPGRAGLCLVLSSDSVKRRAWGSEVRGRMSDVRRTAPADPPAARPAPSDL